jgi:hemolysin III
LSSTIDLFPEVASLKWAYDKNELIADGIVHAVGVMLGIVSIIALVILAAPVVGAWEFTSILVYGAGLLTVLTVSALYNLWPVSPVKWSLRRFDHSAIYLLIAGTYTPFITQMKANVESSLLLVGVWLTSVIGIALKLKFPGRFDRLSILLYLLLSWSGVMAYESVFGALPASTLWLLAIGGILYTIGVLFHLWEGLRFQNAIWHTFVLVAAACHYTAVLDCLVLARA